MRQLTAGLQRFAGLYGLGSYLQSARQIEIDDVLVDAEAIVRRHFHCDGSSCLYEKRLGRARIPRLIGDCCHGTNIWLAPDERERLLRHLPGIIPFMAPRSREALETRLKRYRHDPALAFSRPVRVLGRSCGEAIVRHEQGGDCTFRDLAQEDGRPVVHCAIHGYALSAGLPLWEIKPMVCWAWPVTLLPLMDGRILLTLHTPDTCSFTDEERYFASRPCLMVPAPGAPPVYRAVEPQLRRLLGDDFYERLLAAIADDTTLASG